MIGLKSLAALFLIWLLTVSRAEAEEGWNYIGQWEGAKTAEFDTIRMGHRQSITGLSRRALLIHGVSTVVLDGTCSLDIEAGYTFNQTGGMWRADELLSASRSFGQRGAIAVVFAPTKITGFDPVRVNVFRTDSTRSTCRYRVYQRYRTLSYALFQAQLTGAMETAAAEALRGLLPGGSSGANQRDGGVIIALVLANHAISDFLKNEFTSEMATAGVFTPSMRIGIHKSVLKSIAKHTGRLPDRDLELYANVIGALVRDVFWSLYKDPLEQLAAN